MPANEQRVSDALAHCECPMCGAPVHVWPDYQDGRGTEYEYVAPHPDTAPAGVRELVGKWRQTDVRDFDGCGDKTEACWERLGCAQELEQALAALPDGREDGE